MFTTSKRGNKALTLEVLIKRIISSLRYGICVSGFEHQYNRGSPLKGENGGGGVVDCNCIETTVMTSYCLSDDMVIGLERLYVNYAILISQPLYQVHIHPALFLRFHF